MKISCPRATAQMSTFAFTLPYSEARRLDVLYKDARVENVEYLTDVISVLAVCEPRTLGWIRVYIKEDRGAVT